MGVDFIVVDSYSPYTAIVARPWLHALGAVSSTLHQKVKYHSEGLVKEILGNQSVTTAFNARPATFLATFMWRRLLNSIVLTTIIHREPEKMPDGTCTQMKV